MAFEAILDEVDQLHHVSTRLEGLAELHLPITEALMSIAGNVRNTATILAVLVATRSPKPI
jgi:4-hydroxy-3-methylbut-2-en-1-yl diphosphate synthase IspG/GcpE